MKLDKQIDMPEFKEDKNPAEELKQLHEPKPFKPVESAPVSDEERKKAMGKFTVGFLILAVILCALSFIFVCLPIMLAGGSFLEGFMGDWGAVTEPETTNLSQNIIQTQSETLYATIYSIISI